MLVTLDFGSSSILTKIAGLVGLVGMEHQDGLWRLREVEGIRSVDDLAMNYKYYYIYIYGTIGKILITYIFLIIYVQLAHKTSNEKLWCDTL